MSAIVVITTAGSKEEAHRMAYELVERRLAAWIEENTMMHNALPVMTATDLAPGLAYDRDKLGLGIAFPVR